MTNYDKILQDAIDMDLTVKKFLIVEHTEKDKEDFIESLQKKFDNLHTNFKSIFKMISQGDMDIQKLKYMIKMVKQVQQSKISEHDASVEVGKELFKEYVEPHVNKK